MTYDKLICNIANYANDLAETVRAFAPDMCQSEGGDVIYVEAEKDANIWKCAIKYGDAHQNYSKLSENLEEKHFKRYLKVCLYVFLSDLTGRDLPYGSLTGVRPLKLLRELLKTGDESLFVSYYGVSEKKAELMLKTVQTQQNYLHVCPDAIDLFVNIPVCKSRCSYCSFTCGILSALSKYIPLYVNKLSEEIMGAKRIIAENGYRLNTVYVGGGTPTVLCDADFERILSLLPAAKEVTVEAGRPDSISISKLQIMADRGVSRISINPQTFHDATLQKIGRAHTAQQTYEAYQAARKFPFLINMDLIAMLPDESRETFHDSLLKTVALSPENITVHSLALKKGSVLKNEQYRREVTGAGWTDLAFETLLNAGYSPYYLYRQKYMSGGENCGYAKEGTVCVYNIDNMEETVSVLACGAGGISKRVEGERIERCADAKDVITYLQRFDELQEKKSKFFKK